LWVRDTALKLRQQGIELNKRALQLTSKNSGVFKTTPQVAKQSWSMKTGRGDEDISWLL
jgi:N-acetylmuramoyl-L-alanine amidase CwlA